MVNGGAEQEAISRGLQGAEIAQSMYSLKKSGLDLLFGELPGNQHIPGYELTRNMIETGILGVNPEPGQPTPAIDINTSQHGLNSTYYQVAEALSVGPETAHIPSQFFENGHLKSPDQIATSDLDAYSTTLQQYLFSRGYPSLGSDFDRFYEDGAGK